MPTLCRANARTSVAAPRRRHTACVPHRMFDLPIFRKGLPATVPASICIGGLRARYLAKDSPPSWHCCGEHSPETLDLACDPTSSNEAYMPLLLIWCWY